jgi:hypothetical protein
LFSFCLSSFPPLSFPNRQVLVWKTGLEKWWFHLPTDRHSLAFCSIRKHSQWPMLY